MNVWGMTDYEYDEWMGIIEQRNAERDMRNKQPTRIDLLSPMEWMRLMRVLGWWDSGVSEEEFWERLSSWDGRLEALSGTLESRQSLASVPSPSVPWGPGLPVQSWGVWPRMAAGPATGAESLP